MNVLLTPGNRQDNNLFYETIFTVKHFWLTIDKTFAFCVLNPKRKCKFQTKKKSPETKSFIFSRFEMSQGNFVLIDFAFPKIVNPLPPLKKETVDLHPQTFWYFVIPFENLYVAKLLQVYTIVKVYTRLFRPFPFLHYKWQIRFP